MRALLALRPTLQLGRAPWLAFLGFRVLRPNQQAPKTPATLAPNTLAGINAAAMRPNSKDRALCCLTTGDATRDNDILLLLPKIDSSSLALEEKQDRALFFSELSQNADGSCILVAPLVVLCKQAGGYGWLGDDLDSGSRGGRVVGLFDELCLTLSDTRLSVLALLFIRPLCVLQTPKRSRVGAYELAGRLAVSCLDLPSTSLRSSVLYQLP